MLVEISDNNNINVISQSEIELCSETPSLKMKLKLEHELKHELEH